jgi:hypothetical protein
MKTFLLILLLFISNIALAAVHVKGYYKSNGTYVQPHYRSSPNGTVLDNYSTKGNVNPYTGKEGTVNPPLYSYSPSNSISSPAVKNLTPLTPNNGSNRFNGIPIYELGN